MSQPFSLNIGTRKVSVSPQDDVKVTDGELTGTFQLNEDNAQKGTIRFDKKSWENKDTGDLSYIELEAIAEDIMMQYT